MIWRIQSLKVSCVFEFFSKIFFNKMIMITMNRNGASSNTRNLRGTQSKSGKNNENRFICQHENHLSNFNIVPVRH